MKKFLIGSIIALSSFGESSTYLSGSNLLKMFTESPFSAKAYVAGVIDTADELIICIPEGVKLDDLVQNTKLFLEYMNTKDGSKMSASADSFVIGPLKYSYPCKSGKDI